MRFREILSEKFLTGVHDIKHYYEIYENPTPSDIKYILKAQDDLNKKIKIIRFGVDKDNNLFGWNGYVLHFAIEEQFKKKFYLRIDYNVNDQKFSISSEQESSGFQRIDFKKLIVNLEKTGLDKEKINDFVKEVRKEAFGDEFELNEEISFGDLKIKGIEDGVLESLTKFMINSGLKLEPLPEIKVIDDNVSNSNDLFGKTAGYDIQKKVIVLYTKNRNPEDIIRSFAHEMIHHKQNLNNELDDITTQDTNESKRLEKLEKEAYEEGGILLRKWKDKISKSDKNLINEMPHSEFLPDHYIDFERELDKKLWLFKVIDIYDKFPEREKEITKNLIDDLSFCIAFRIDFKAIGEEEKDFIRKELPKDFMEFIEKKTINTNESKKDEEVSNKKFEKVFIDVNKDWK
jgi:hypothetical protein